MEKPSGRWLFQVEAMTDVTLCLCMLLLLVMPSTAEAGRNITCQDPELRSFPFCDPDLPVDERTDDLVSRMTVEELISQMQFEAPAIARLGIPVYNWGTECLHGVRTPCGTNCPTSFPAPCALGATFNMELIHKMARAISDEARALNNEGVSGLEFWAPNININRDPRWGRNMEVPGEDTYLTGQYAKNFVRGLQEGFDPRYPQAVATCKHYAVYSLEQWDDYNRFSFKANVSDYDLADTYFPAFRSCVVEGRARSIMCSYTAVNGIPSCVNEFLLQTVLRETWGFDGYVASDCDAVQTAYDPQNYTSTPEETCQAALKAGTDLNCGSFYQQYLGSTYKKGMVSEREIKRSVKRFFRQRFELGMWDPPEKQPYRRITPSVVDSKEHSSLALQAAREAIVLLQNKDRTLPLSKSIRNVAVIGPNANATETLLGNYYGQRCHDGTYNCITSPTLAIQAKIPNAKVTYVKGCEVNSNALNASAVVQAARAADVAILVLGLNQDVEREGLDRVDITLPGMQDKLFEAVYQTGTPTVVVLVHGGALAIENIKEKADAIVDAFYPGENGGFAIADVLFGDYNPGGRLPATAFTKDYVNMVPLSNMSMRAGEGNPGRTYRYYTGPAPLWEFGFGLSYTTFKYEWINEPPSSFHTSFKEELWFRVRVTNIGKVAGDEVVLAFVRRNETTLGPLKQLFGFKRLVAMLPGESREVFFAAGPDALASSAEEGFVKVMHPSSFQIEVGVGETKLVHPIKVVGPAYEFPML